MNELSSVARDFVGVDRIEGPIVVVEGEVGAAYGEMVEIMAGDGNVRVGRVLDTSQERAVVELWRPSAGLRASQARIRFRGRPFQAPGSEGSSGRN